MNRRSMLAGAGVSLTALIAGCTESSDVEGGSRDGEEGTDEESTDEERTSANLEIVDHELVVEEGDFSTDVYVEATVENTGDAPSGDVQLQADWYDGDGNYLDNDTGRLSTLGVGETWSARVYHLGSGAENIDDYEIEGEFDEDTYEPPEGVSLVDSSLNVQEDDLGDMEVVVEGRVENETEEDQSYVEVVAIIYNDSGDVIGDDWTNVTDLRAGETWAFDFTSFGAAIRNRAEQATDHKIRIKTSAW